jgi:hypothetical protein
VSSRTSLPESGVLASGEGSIYGHSIPGPVARATNRVLASAIPAWRAGARISLLKRRHGLNRCRYKGLPGVQRWVGLGVIADNLINIGHALAPSAER